MKTAQKKILLSGLVAIFAFIITIGSTYAWFTVGQSADVSEVTLTIDSSESILILLDNGYSLATHEALLSSPSSYNQVLRNSDFIGIYDITSANIAMEPLTSVNGESIVQRDGTTSARFTTDSINLNLKGQYVEFSVWLFSQSESVSIGLSDLSITANNPNTNKNDIVKALRMSVTSSAAVNALKIFGNNRDYSFQFQSGDVGYSGDSSDLINPTVANDLIALHGVYYTTGPTVSGESTNVKTDSSALFNLVANTPTKATIRIWVEGWDSHARNNLIGAVFSIGFSFTIREVIT